MSSIVLCLLLSCFTFHLGFVYPLQDVALHQCLPLSSVCCFPDPGGSLLPCYVVLPASALSSSWSLPSPWLPLCAAFGPPIVLHSCYMSGPCTFLLECVFYNVNYVCSFPDAINEGGGRRPAIWRLKSVGADAPLQHQAARWRGWSKPPSLRPG